MAFDLYFAGAEKTNIMEYAKSKKRLQTIHADG